MLGYIYMLMTCNILRLFIFMAYYQGQIRKGLCLKIALSSSRFHMYAKSKDTNSLSSHQKQSTRHALCHTGWQTSTKPLAPDQMRRCDGYHFTLSRELRCWYQGQISPVFSFFYINVNQMWLNGNLFLGLLQTH